MTQPEFDLTQAILYPSDNFPEILGVAPEKQAEFLLSKLEEIIRSHKQAEQILTDEIKAVIEDRKIRCLSYFRG